MWTNGSNISKDPAVLADQVSWALIGSFWGGTEYYSFQYKKIAYQESKGLSYALTRNCSIRLFVIQCSGIVGLDQILSLSNISLYCCR